MKAQNLICVSFLLIIILLTSCKDKTFTKTKNATKEIHSFNGSSVSAVKIKSYSLTFNPKANGFIKLELESGAEYQAKSVDGGSFSSINSLLKEPEVLFDITTTELIVEKSIQ